MNDLSNIQQRLGYTFKDTALLELALTHPSVAHELGAGIQHNQRLEFLGDSVLGVIITSELFKRFPDFGEGPLTKARAQMVNRRALADQGRRLLLGECLRLSRGEETTGGRERESSLADAFEAVVGALYVDGGFEVAREFILRSFLDAFGELSEIPNLENPKGELQELLQADSSEPPQYEVTAVSGPDHDRVYECVVLHAGVELGRGKGKSKKSAESDAALAALQNRRSTTPQ